LERRLFCFGVRAIFDAALEIGRGGQHIMARGENARGKSKTLEILADTDVPVNIVLENEGCGEVLFDDSVLVLARSLL
jgi:hypothetical protein